MICHICFQPAIGQCQRCLRFYCSSHGDLKCDECSLVIDEPAVEKPAVAPPASSCGTECFACYAQASGSCGQCGRFCCEEHIDAWRNCVVCRRQQLGAAMVILAFAGVMIMVLLILLSVERSQRTQVPSRRATRTLLREVSLVSELQPRTTLIAA